MVGKRFGRWIVLEFSHSKGTQKYWKCQCECGTVRIVRQLSLTSGRSKSCGCYHNELAREIGARSLTHGDFGTKLYGIWAGMKRRCQNPNTKFYNHYGGRGIKVCDEWQEYIAFKEWAMQNGYQEGLSIERRNVNGNYCPDNCEWISRSEQGKNTRRIIHIKYQGKSYTIKEIAEITGLKERTIMGRVERGWDADRIFTSKLFKNKYDKGT